MFLTSVLDVVKFLGNGSFFKVCILALSGGTGPVAMLLLILPTTEAISSEWSTRCLENYDHVPTGKWE